MPRQSSVMSHSSFVFSHQYSSIEVRDAQEQKLDRDDIRGASR